MQDTSFDETLLFLRFLQDPNLRAETCYRSVRPRVLVGRKRQMWSFHSFLSYCLFALWCVLVDHVILPQGRQSTVAYYLSAPALECLHRSDDLQCLSTVCYAAQSPP